MFHIHVPKHPLSDFIECFVDSSGYEVRHSIDRFLPDGNTEVVIDLTETPKHIYDNSTLNVIQTCREIWVSGVRTEPISVPSGKDSAMFVISFKKGRAFPFFSVPMSELSDHVIEGGLLWKSFASDLRDALLHQRTARGRFAIAEQMLHRHFRQRLRLDECVSHAVRRIVSGPGTVRMDSLMCEIGYSHKHFIDLFRKAVGVTPKSFLTIMRFQDVVAKIENGRDDWSQLALDCGYYDQPHFVHDFRRFSGFTPGEYRLRKSTLLNYVPVG